MRNYAKLASMKHRIGLVVVALALVGAAGCGDDSGGDETGSVVSTGSMASTGDASSTGSVASTGGSTAGPASSSGAVDGDSSSEGSSSGGGPACDPPIVGEFNACTTPDGTIDNTMCNWMGNPKANGFLTCLSSADIKGGNVCTIANCVDACDCFDPPPTGTAGVVCAPILADGDNACGLDCSNGETCPDGMECGGGLCFWPPG